MALSEIFLDATRASQPSQHGEIIVAFNLEYSSVSCLETGYEG